MKKGDISWAHDFGDLVVGVVPNPKLPIVAVFVSDDKGVLSSTFYPRLFIKKLYFLELERGEIELRSPEGELHHCDWNFEIWSRGGSYVALLQDHFGPIYVFKAIDLFMGLKDKPFRVIGGRNPESDNPAKVVGFVEWESDQGFVYSQACCGKEASYKCDVASGKEECLREVDLRTGRELERFPVRIIRRSRVH